MQITDISEYKILSIKKVTGQVIERSTFCPGEYDQLEKFAPELLDKAREIWTDDVIEEWKKHLENTEIPNIGTTPTLPQETAVLYTAIDEIFTMLVDSMEFEAMLMTEIEALKQKG